MQLEFSSQALTIQHQQQLLFSHQADAPAFYIGKGREKMEIYRGNFDIEDYIESRVALTHIEQVDNNLFVFARMH